MVKFLVNPSLPGLNDACGIYCPSQNTCTTQYCTTLNVCSTQYSCPTRLRCSANATPYIIGTDK